MCQFIYSQDSWLKLWIFQKSRVPTIFSKRHQDIEWLSKYLWMKFRILLVYQKATRFELKHNCMLPHVYYFSNLTKLNFYHHHYLWFNIDKLKFIKLITFLIKVLERFLHLFYLNWNLTLTVMILRPNLLV